MRMKGAGEKVETPKLRFNNLGVDWAQGKDAFIPLVFPT